MSVKVIDMYPQKIARVATAWDSFITSQGAQALITWTTKREQELVELLTLVAPRAAHLVAQDNGLPNIDVQLSETGEETDVSFVRAISTRYVGFSEKHGEHYYEEDTERVFCTFAELAEEMDETVSCLTISLSNLANASPVFPID